MFLCLTSLSMTISRSIHVATNAIICFFLRLSNIPFYIYIWRTEWLPTPVFLSGEFQGQRSLAGYSLWGCKELDTNEWLTHTHTHTHRLPPGLSYCKQHCNDHCSAYILSDRLFLNSIISWHSDSQLRQERSSLKLISGFRFLKDPDAGRYWRQEEKGTTEDEMVGWHHPLNRHEFEQAPEVGDGQGSLGCCSPWGCRVGHDWATEPNWTEYIGNPHNFLFSHQRWVYLGSGEN